MLNQVLRSDWNPFVCGLRAYCGPNGSGKSLLAVAQVALPAMRRGYPVVSNLNLDPAAVGLDPALFVPLTSWRQIPYLGVQKRPADSITGNRPCVLLLDEITSCLPARQTLNVPPELLRVMDQFRKQKTVVVVTAPTFPKIDKFLRSNIQIVTICEGYRPDKWQRGAAGKPVRVKGRRVRYSEPWAPFRRVRFWHYNAFEVENFDKNSVRTIEPVGHGVYWRAARWQNAQRAYDTQEHVRLLDLVDDNYCAHCSKKVRGSDFCSGDHGPEAKSRQPQRVRRAVA